MKTSSPYLYELVQQLTKSEKRYVKVQSGGGDKDYIQLMDALLAQKGFDEEKLIKKHSGANFIKHLAVNKRYLYEFVLRSLDQFGEQSQEDRARERIAAAKILVNKGMFKAALGELKKGQKIIDKYELFHLQIPLCSVEKQLLGNRQFIAKEKNAILSTYEKEVYSLQQLQNTNEYWRLLHQLAQFQMQNQRIRTDEHREHIKGIIESPQFQDIELATNFKSRLYFYQANSTYHFLEGDVKSAYEMNRQILDLLDSQSHFLRLYTERYISTLNNTLIDSLMLGNFGNLETGLERLSTLPQQTAFKSVKNIESRVFRQRHMLLINWSLSQNDWKKAMDWIPSLEEGLVRFKNKIEKHHRITFHYLMAYILFQNADYERALHWNDHIIDEAKEDVVKEIFYFARVLNILVHYELENYHYLESLLLSTPKYLRARRALYETEKSLFRLLRKLLNATSKKEKATHQETFKEELLEHAQNPKERRVFNYLDLRKWAGV